MIRSDFTVATPRGPIAAQATGDGPAVALIAGLGSTARLWGELPGLLGRRFTVIALDNRGVGGSRTGQPFTLGGAAADVVAVLDATGHESAAVVGASMGGVIGLELAVTVPRRVRRLVVASAAAHLSRHGRRSLELLVDLLRHLPPAHVGQAFMTLAFSPTFHERFAGFVSEASRLYGIDPADVPGALAQAEYLLEGWDLRAALRELAVPTMVIAGDRDPLVAWEDSAAAAAAIPGSTLVRVPDAAHSVLAEAGAELLDGVIAFLADGSA